MASFFRGTVQSTPFQQAIEKVTDGNQANEDWGLIMKICDHVGSHEESAKEAMKIIRKRLQINPLTNGWRSIGYTLTLLEALTKNCGKIFHLQIAHKDFLKELKGVIGPKNNPPVVIQARVLGMIQTWALAFRQDPDLKTVEHFYQECKQQGLEFPPAESDAFIKTAVSATGTIERPLQQTRAMNQPVSNEQSHPAAAGPMSAEQVAKLRSELDVVQTNAQVFGEMLVTLQPGEEDPQDFELLTELHNTCKQMQARIVDLLAQVTIDDITVDLLRYNDEFNNSFITFENYMQERDRRFHSSPMPRLNSRTSPIKTSTNNADNEPSLIRFDDEPIAITPPTFQNISINRSSPDAIPKYIPPQSTASAMTRPVTNSQDPERDVKEIEQWLKFQGDDSDHEDQPRPESGTTPAFNNFLQKRASTIPDESTSQQHVYPNLQSNTHM
jgi:hypothetical protein